MSKSGHFSTAVWLVEGPRGHVVFRPVTVVGKSKYSTKPGKPVEMGSVGGMESCRPTLASVGGYGSGHVHEFSNASLNNLQDVYQQVELCAALFHVLPLTFLIVLEAVRGVNNYQFSCYDALIRAAAKVNQVPHVLTEDCNSGATIEEVRFRNPFASGFDPDVL